MNVLIDTNVVLTYVMGREDKYKDAIEKVMGLCAENKIQGYIAFHTLSTMWYVLGKDFKDIRREMMNVLLHQCQNILLLAMSRILPKAK